MPDWQGKGNTPGTGISGEGNNPEKGASQHIQPGRTLDTLLIALPVAGGIIALAGVYLMFSWWSYWRGNYAGKLLTGGPYALVRHPYYLGFALTVAGLALAFPDASLIALALFTPLALAYYIPKEEDRLLNQYRKLYEEYRRRVPWRLIPRVW